MPSVFINIKFNKRIRWTFDSSDDYKPRLEASYPRKFAKELS